MDGIYFADIQISKQESSFAAAIDRRGAIYAWGPNFDGQLGHGDFNTRTLPTQIARLKRKQIRATALGDRFAIAIGKDVSMADLMRRKAAKAKKQQEMNAQRAVHMSAQKSNIEDRNHHRNMSAPGIVDESSPLRRHSSSTRQEQPRNISTYSKE